MRVIRPKAAILEDRVLADFARSLQASDLAAATCRGYAADLGRFRAWVEDGRGEGVALRKIGALDLANYRQHLIRTEKLRPPASTAKSRRSGNSSPGPGTKSWSSTIPRPPCASCAARSAGSPGGFAKKKFRGCCGQPARAATGWRAATTPSFNCCCKPACAWAKLRAWRSPIAKSTPVREWSSCAPEKAGRSARFP